jgi:hypothetical protein
MHKLKALSQPLLRFTTDHRCRLGFEARQQLDAHGFCWAVVEYRDGGVTPVSLHHSVHTANRKMVEEYQIMKGEIATLEMLRDLGFDCPYNPDSEFEVVIVKREERAV